MDVKFLDNFIIQSQTDNLKTKDLYPKSIFDLDMKVSFGMGVPTYVPWISILGPGMTTSNGYYPVYLYYKKENILILAYGISETNPFENPWTLDIVEENQKISEFLTKPFKYKDSYVFKSYTPEISNDVVTYSNNGVQIPHPKIEEDLKNIVSAYKKCLDITVKDETSDFSKGLFYMEKQLEDFIVENWNETQFGKKYDLIFEDGELKSQQFRTDIGIIDILAKDKNDDSFVVIELKKNQTSDDTVGQITRYMGWIEEKYNTPNVKGVIVAGTYDKKLYYAQKILKDIEVFLYEINFKLNEYKKEN